VLDDTCVARAARIHRRRQVRLAGWHSAGHDRNRSVAVEERVQIPPLSRSPVILNTMTHEYTVELRIWGKTLDPDAVTRETGLQPCQIRLAGSQFAGRNQEESMWAFDGESPYRGESLEDGLALLLNRVEPVQELVAKYMADHYVVWWCGHFQSSFDGGPVLSGELLRRVGEFGATLFIDNYFSTDESEA
jgi:hypothetical protein